MNQFTAPPLLASDESLAMDLYFESLLDRYTTAFRWMARKARDDGPFRVHHTHMLVPHIRDILTSAQDDPLAAVYVDMMNFEYKHDHYTVSLRINI